LQEFHKSLRHRLFHHYTLRIRVHDVNIGSRFNDVLYFVVTDAGGAAFRDGVEMVLEKLKLALMSGNFRIPHKHLGHPLVDASEQVPVEENQIKTGNRGPDIVAANQT
jgi:hypothetical protein